MPNATRRFALPEPARLSLAFACAMLFYFLYAGVRPFSREGCGPGVTFSPTGCYLAWQSSMAVVVNFLTTVFGQGLLGWRLAYALGVFAPPALVAMIAYAFLTRRYGPAVANQPACRVCGYCLRGVSQPRCPECGERV